MDISVNREHMEKIAKELGIEISFDNPPEECGVLNTTTGELQSWDDVTKDMLEFIGETTED